MKRLNNKGFTLTELIVVTAVSSIFLGIVVLILASSFNIFGKNQSSANIFSDTVIIDNMVTVFSEEVNKDGVKLKFDDELNKLYYEDAETVYSFQIIEEENKVIMILPSRSADNIKEYQNINIDIKLSNEKENTESTEYSNFVITYEENGELVKQTIVYVLGGVSNV